MAFKTSDKLKGDVGFFDKLHKLIGTPLRVDHMYTFLLSRDLGNFLPKDHRPITEGYLESQAMNIPDAYMSVHQEFPGRVRLR